MPLFDDWPAITLATLRDPLARRPFRILHRGEPVTVGSVARRDLAALQRWPAQLHVDEHGADLLAPEAARSGVLAEINAVLRAQGLVPGWRDEPYPIASADDPTLTPLAVTERAASRFWGTLTFGAHCNGYVRGTDGRPSHLWIARRSATKATDPGKLDNMVGGGVPHGQSMRQALIREAWEEAGLAPAFAARALEGRIVMLDRDVPEGRQHEWIQVYDLEMPVSYVPSNQDGEVMGFARLTIAEALACAAGSEMTVDAALVTLDFALRHRLLEEEAARRLAETSAALWRRPPETGTGIRWR